MFRNYFITAFRNLWKNKFYSSINITGLSVGLAVGIMILLWVQDELSYNSFHRNADHIYKINSHLGTGTGEQVWEGAPSPVALFSKKEIPEVADAMRLRGNMKGVYIHMAVINSLCTILHMSIIHFLPFSISS